MSLLKVRDLSIRFNSSKGIVHAVNNISFTMPSKHIIGLVGESGSGKSVTSLAIMNLIKETGGWIESGQVEFKGVDLRDEKEKALCRIRGKEISMIFQDPMTALNPSYTVYRQINEVFIRHGFPKRKKEEVRELLEQLHIANAQEVLGKYPFELSGGIAQRVMIAMALALNPALIIADEPTTALDVTTQAEILKLLQDIKNDRDIGVLLITHDLGVMAEIAEQIMVMYQGQIVEACNIVSFFDDPKHPYTKDLINARPENFNGRFSTIKGQVETAYGELTYCPYAPRCKKSMEICFKDLPPEVWLKEDHRVRCWQYVEKGECDGSS